MFCFQGESPPNNIRIDSLLHLMYQKIWQSQTRGYPHNSVDKMWIDC